MGGDLPSVRVGDLVAAGVLAINDGYRMRNDELGSLGTPFVRGGDIGNGWINHQTSDCIRPEFGQRIATKLTQPWDVAFITKGTVGRVGILKPDQPQVVFAPQVAYWRSLDHDQLHPRFIYYLLSGPEFQARLDADKTHGAMVADYVSLSQQLNFRLSIPGVEQQRAIARVLGALDDKIELNRRMNATLEAMARALFKSWFVDFDPVRAKAEGRDPSGMDAETAKLFPSEFVDSEMGMIPKGWSVAPLQDMTSYLSRGIGPAYIDDGGVCVLNQKCIRGHRVDFSNARRHDAAKKSIEGRLVRDLDILVNSTGVGTLGRVAQIWRLIEDTIVDSHVTVVRAASNVDHWFLGVSIIDREPEIEALGEGSTGQTELSRVRLGGLLGVRPSEELQRRFGNAVSNQLRRIAENEREAHTLARLRDDLLPRLLSGEVSVDAAEREVEAVA